MNAAPVDRQGGPVPHRVHSALGSAVHRAATWFAARPWWLQAALVYAASRVVGLAVFSAAAYHQGTNPWYGPQPDYGRFVQIWDAEWYGRIIQNGYPSQLPRSDAGAVQENAWAFYPVYPLLVKGLAAASGLPWQAVAQTVALLAGLGACLVAYRLFRLAASHGAAHDTAHEAAHDTAHGTALWGVAFVAFFPISAILQVPYAESLGLLLLAWALLWIVQRRYLATMPVVALMSLTRPIGVPMALALAALFAVRWWRRREAGTTAGELARLAALVVVSGASALAWPVIAWAGTGEMTAYTQTETVWRGGPLELFVPWLETGEFLFGPVAGALAPLVLVAVAALALTSAPVRRVGLELQLWCAAYVVYLLAVLHPQTSTFRMMLPLFPLALAAAGASRSRAFRWSALGFFVLLEIVWVHWLWVWTPLPGGGDWPP